MINLENRIERDELIDDYFNKGYACDIREVYQAVVNTIADLEYANDEKIKEIDRLNQEIIGLNNCIIEFHSEFCYKQAEINRLRSIIKEVREYRNVLYHRYYEKGFDTDSAMIIKELDKILDKENK